MHSYRVLGVVALSAIVLAVICFTVVDITIDGANGCLGTRALCREHEVPAIAVGYAVIGGLAVLVSAGFASGWLVGMLRHPAPEESLPRSERLPRRPVEEEL